MGKRPGRWILRTASFAVALALGSQPGFAQTCPVTMTNVSFGNVAVLGGGTVDATGTVDIDCSGGAPPNNPTRNCISIAAGPVDDATSRRLSSGANRLRYDLYSDAARTVRWGSWETGYQTAGATLDVNYNSSASRTVYGRVLGLQQTTPPGTYTTSFSGQPFNRFRYNTTETCLVSGTKTSSTSFTVTATVPSACNVSATMLNFGSKGSLSTNTDATSSVSVQCTNTTPYNVGLNAGTGSGATVATRKMTGPASATLNYSLYTTAARTTVWGNTVGTNTVAGTGTGAAQSLTVYGRVPVQSTPATGSYTDTIVVTVTY